MKRIIIILSRIFNDSKYINISIRLIMRTITDHHKTKSITMSNPHAYQKNGNQPYPHIGNLIRKKLYEMNISTAEAARRLCVNTSSMHGYYKQPSLQFGIIWKLSIAINYDLLSDIMAYYPENFPIKVNEKMGAMEKELEIYKGLLKR